MAITPYKVSIGKVRLTGNSASSNLGRDSRADFKEVLANFKGFLDHMGDVLPEVLQAALQPTLELSQYYCPVETGELVGSAYLQTETFRGEARVEIGYAKGGYPHYAIYVHELPKNHAAPTTYKFLQRAIDEDLGAVQGRIIAGLKEASGT